MTVKMCLAALLVAILAQLLSEMGCRSKRLFTLLFIVLFISMLSGGIIDVFSSAMSFADTVGLGETAKCAAKAVGLGYVFGFTADVCEEMGERGIANAVTLGARVEIFLVVLPYFKQAMQLGIELLQ